MTNHPNRSSTSVRAILEMAASALGISISAEFVPFSQSRNKGEPRRSLNWRATISHNGRAILTTDYSAGEGHCPAYNLSVKQAGGRNSLMRDEMLAYECEHGRVYRIAFSGFGPKIAPPLADILASLMMESDVLDFGGFEDWASNFAFDPDSRSAETIYRACLEIGLKLRMALGDTNLAKLRKIAANY